MKIKSITDILNFRFHPVYLNWPLSCSKGERSILNDPPVVQKYFRASFTQGGVFYNKTRLPHSLCDGERLGVWGNRHPGLLQNIDRVGLIESGEGVLVVAGSDVGLKSRLPLLKKLKPYFSKIYYEAKDIECDWVETIPMGMNLAYLLRAGGSKILDVINSKKNKTKLIGTAFGSKWPGLNGKIGDRKALMKLYKSSDLIENFFCPPIEYFQNLSKYKFFASPLGNGIQTPKICESIMCETVPVVTSHVAHRELRDIHGLPLLIIDKWEDLTEDFLYNEWNTKYKFIDWSAEKSKFLVDNFADLYLK
jgi:hypothetical protein